MTVDKKIVKGLWYLPYDGNDEEGVEVIEDTVTGNSRWSVQHRLIVKIKDKFYETHYQVASTECQDEQPWEYDNKVVFEEVKMVAKTIDVWELVLNEQD